jgi:hypothetical protein
MTTIAGLVKEYYDITGSGSTNKLTNLAKAACGCADILTKQLPPEQFEAVKNWLKNDAITKGKYKQDVETTPYAHEIVPTPTQPDSMCVQASKKGKTGGSIVKRADKVAAKDTRTLTTTFIVTPAPNTQVRIYLEPEFVVALESFAPDKQAQREFLKNVGLAGNSANPSSNARCAIVTELLARVQP